MNSEVSVLVNKQVSELELEHQLETCGSSEVNG